MSFLEGIKKRVGIDSGPKEDVEKPEVAEMHKAKYTSQGNLGGAVEPLVRPDEKVAPTNPVHEFFKKIAK